MEEDESITYEAQSQVLCKTLEVKLSGIVSQEEDPQVHGARRNAMESHDVGQLPIVNYVERQPIYSARIVDKIAEPVPARRLQSDTLEGGAVSERTGQR